MSQLIKEARIGLSKTAAEAVFDEGAENGANVEMIEQSDGNWTVTIIYTIDSAEEVEGDVGSTEMASAVLEKMLPTTGNGLNTELGILSERFESNGDPGSIGYDLTGGFSYGSYQIATRTGTMRKFLNFVKIQHPSIFEKLAMAGGEAAAINGTPAFKDTWRLLAKQFNFGEAQHEFIKETHYDPLVHRIKIDLGLDVEKRSSAIQNVVWSVGVQNGPNNMIFHRALQGQDMTLLDDLSIIRLVFTERSKVDKYFEQSTDQVRMAVAERFKKELHLAESMLA